MAAPRISETRRFSQEQRVAASRFTRYRERMTSMTGITATGAVMLCIAVVAWVIARLVGGRPLFMISYGLFGVFIAAYVIGRRTLPLTGERSASRPRLTEGETVTIGVSLIAKRRLSTFVLEEQMPATVGTPARVPVASVASGESVDHSYKLTLPRRGAYTLGPLVARSGDPLGFTQREQVLCEPYEVLVHPAVERVQDRPLTRLFEDPPIRPPVSKPWPSGMEFYGMRKYTPGDDIRRVVWRAYARTGQLLVRESEQGITDKITLVVDQDRRTHSKGTPSESFETAIRAAASLGTRHLREGYSVTLEGNAKRQVPAMRGASAQMMFLDALARMELGKEPLADPIVRLLSDPSRDNHVVILTPHLDHDAAGRLRLLVERGVSVLVAALMWDESAHHTIATAASLGCQVVEVRPNTPLARAFRREVGAGLR
jgi:uncharacterized protein (DUF58 family)